MWRPVSCAAGCSRRPTRRAAAGAGRGCWCFVAARSCASARPRRGCSTWGSTGARRVRVDAPRGRSYVSAAPMTLALYNTLSRRVEPFAPLAPPRVTLYTCGPTVWNYAHIGNFRTFLFEDLLRRYLAYSGYDVFHIMNLTDVDDRTIKAAAAAGKRLAEHTAPFIQAFFEDRDYLRIVPAHVYPRATESVPAMVRLVERLLERGVAYKGEDGSIYFAIAKFPGYGRLSRLDTRELKIGARVASDEYAKDDPRDFAPWKKADAVDEQVGAAWDAPFGRGRPGWHLECSAMSLEQVEKCCRAETLDIHAGDVDFRAALDDDLNAPRAGGALFDFVHQGNAALDAGASGAATALGVLDRAMAVLDVLPTAKTVDAGLTRWIEDRIAARDKARKSKDFKEADRIRAELTDRGVEIEDTPSGAHWRLV